MVTGMQPGGTDTPFFERIVIVGNPDSLFAYQLAESWQPYCNEVCILTVPDFYKGATAGNNIKVLSTEAFVSKGQLKKWKKQADRLRRVEKLSYKFDGAAYRKARQEYVFETGIPSVKRPYLYGKQLSQALSQISPDFVFVQEAYTYGGLSLFYREAPVVIFPFGGDIYTHSQTSWVSHLYMKRVLKKADLIMPTAVSAVSYLIERFRLSGNKVKPVSWGVDRSEFFPMKEEEKEAAKLKWGIPASAKVILNIRRFRPGWGASAALETFIHLAKEHPEKYYMVLLGGAGKDEKSLQEALVRLKNEKLTDRIRLLEERISLEEVSELMGMAEVFVNLMAKEDMRSFSIIQGVARGSLPVMVDQPEYRYMEKEGFKSLFVQDDKPAEIAEAIHGICSSPAALQKMKAENLDYITREEDGAVQVRRMLEVIKEFT